MAGRPHISPSNMSFGFTLLELLVVIAVIAIVAAFLIPALGPSSGRTVDGATRQFTADLENARLIAIAERTRTRVLLPKSATNFAPPSSSPSSSPAPSPTDVVLRGYLVTSRNGLVWKQRGKWNRLPQGVAFDSSNGVFAAPTPTPPPVPTPTPAVDIAGNGTANFDYSGPYIEFLANGSSSLDAAATPGVVAAVADGFVAPDESFKAKNSSLRFSVVLDPLSGAVSVQ